MQSFHFLALCVALFGLFATQAFAADTCLGVPMSVKDTTCGGLLGCPYGQYCDKTAQCVDTKALGAACESGYECGDLAFCRGPTDTTKICVAISGPGGACTGNFSIPSADCSSIYLCNTAASPAYCEGGKFGDACAADAHCTSEKCTGGACDGSVGVTCFDSTQCSPANYCDGTTNTCAARLAVGANCGSASEGCVAGSVCAMANPELSYENRTCIAKASIAAGDFCNGFSALCAKGPCINDHCYADAPAYCQDDNECTEGNLCLCKGAIRTEGYGKCGKYNCQTKYEEALACLAEKCGQELYFHNFVSYPNSCGSRLCQASFDDFVKCNKFYAASKLSWAT